MELPKPWSEGLARLPASALHYRVGRSLISEEIIRQNTKPFAKRTTVKESSSKKLTMGTPKSWSEGLARLATDVHLHDRGQLYCSSHIVKRMVLGSHRHTSPPYTHVCTHLSMCPIGHRTQDVHGVQGTVTPEPSQRPPKPMG